LHFKRLMCKCVVADDEREGCAVEDRIEQTVSINAGLERVWELVTEPGWWVPSDVPVPADRTPGHRAVRESAKWGRFVVEVVRLDPRTYAAFRWASTFPGEDPEPGRSTLVEFFLAERAGAVEVRLVESGFADLELPADGRATAHQDNTGGWREELADLTARAEAA
jgi:uncharacterized protein YndB with AHSA1/START domain